MKNNPLYQSLKVVNRIHGKVAQVKSMYNPTTGNYEITAYDWAQLERKLCEWGGPNCPCCQDKYWSDPHSGYRIDAERIVIV